MASTTYRIRYALVGCLLLSALLLIACNSAPPTGFATPLVSAPIAQATASQTQQLEITPSPFLTNTPISTPTLQPTRTPFPTVEFSLLTPATPQAGPQAYRLAPWSPERADALITLLQWYPKKVDPFIFLGRPDLEYSFFQYAAYAQQEALLHFPTDSNAARWRLGAAANLAISVPGAGGQNYRNVVVDALNRDEVSPDPSELVRWFRAYSSPFAMQVAELMPLPGYLSSRLVSISDDDTGGTTFWVLQTRDGFRAYPLFDDMGDRFSTEYSVKVGDLTGDGIKDAVVYLGDHNGTFIGGQVEAFDLSRVPPARLSFGPQPAWLVSAGWTRGIELKTSQDADPERAYLDVTGEGQLYYYCDIYLNNRFAWNGQWLDLVDATVVFWGDNRQYSCIQLLEEADYLSVVERKAILSFYESVFGDVRPVRIDPESGKNYPPDTQDQFRYILALHHALLGNVVETVTYLDRIVAAPSTPDSQWIKPAQDFLDAYKSAEDVYKLCAEAKIKCNLQRALEQTIQSLPAVQYESIIPNLQELGVPVLTSGYFDFDDDGSLEIWFTVRHTNAKEIELWIIGDFGFALKPIFVGHVPEKTPDFHLHIPPSSSFSSTDGVTVFEVNASGLFHFVRRIDTGEPFVTSFWRRSTQGITEFPWASSSPLSDLLSGIDPVEVMGELQSAEREARFEPGAEHYYSLGLAHELLGNNTEAVYAYWQATQNCCETWTWRTDPSTVIAVTTDPFAVMARAKLEFVP